MKELACQRRHYRQILRTKRSLLHGVGVPLRLPAAVLQLPKQPHKRPVELRVALHANNLGDCALLQCVVHVADALVAARPGRKEPLSNTRAKRAPLKYFGTAQKPLARCRRQGTCVSISRVPKGLKS